MSYDWNLESFFDSNCSFLWCAMVSLYFSRASLLHLRHYQRLSFIKNESLVLKHIFCIFIKIVVILLLFCSFFAQFILSVKWRSVTILTKYKLSLNKSDFWFNLAFFTYFSKKREKKRYRGSQVHHLIEW